MFNILVVEDDKNLRKLITTYLKKIIIHHLKQMMVKKH